MTEQLSLFRRSARRRAPAGVPERAPDRLELGDPSAIAWARAQELELERRAQLERQEQRRARIAIAARRRWQRVRDGQPSPEEVLLAIRTELVEGDYGLPPRRVRLEEHAVDRLRDRYPGIPHELVRATFSQASRDGLIEREGRSWRWSTDIPPSTRRLRRIDELADAVQSRTVLLRAEGDIFGLGTLIRHGAETAILTTQTIWEGIRAASEVELHGTRGASTLVDAGLLTADVALDRLPGVTGTLGPEIAVVWLPRPAESELRRAHKTFHDTTPAPPQLALERAWALGASPLTARSRLHEVSVVERFHAELRERDFEYVDVDALVHGPLLPGAGLWSAALTPELRWGGELLLEGMAFAMEASRARCHGMKEVRALLPSRSS